MATDFAWLISAETDKDELTFKAGHSSHKISDAEIRNFLKIVCEKYDIDIPANFIYNLRFLAADANDNCYAETLSPIDFWPIKPLGLWAENRYMFRTCKSYKKGGEE